jgi:protein-disulfide isomerase
MRRGCFDARGAPRNDGANLIGICSNPFHAGVFDVMPYRTPLAAVALVCSFIVTTHSGPLRAAEIPTEQRQAIEGIIRDYLLHNPDVLIEALHGAEEKLNREADAKAEQVLSGQSREIFDDPATPVGGNPRGDVTIVEFFDYRCPYCKQVLPSLQALLKEDQKLRFLYKEMPVLGPASVTAAHAALAAERQGKYEAFHNAMMVTKGQITDETVYKVAGSVGLDVDRLKRDMSAPEIGQALKTNLALADALNIRGTPGFIVGKHIVPGAIDLDALRNMVAEARKE